VQGGAGEQRVEDGPPDGSSETVSQRTTTLPENVPAPLESFNRENLDASPHRYKEYLQLVLDNDRTLDESQRRFGRLLVDYFDTPDLDGNLMSNSFKNF